LIRADGGRAKKSLRIPRVQGIPLLPHIWGVIDTLILCLSDLGLENWGKNDKHFVRYRVVNYSIPTASGNVASMREPLDGSLWW